MALSYDNTSYDLQNQLDLLNIHAITNKGTSVTSGLYKITANAEGHITGATAVTKADITALGISGQDTIYTLPTATSSALGGIQLGYTSSGKNYAVQVDSSGNAYVNVPWTDNDTTYSAGTGLSLSSGTFSLASVSGLTSGSYGPSANATPAYGATFNVPYITVDDYGRITAISNKTVKIPASDNTDHYAWGDITGKPSSYTPSTHNHGLLHSDFNVTLANTTTDSGWSMINGSYSGFILKSIRYQGSSPAWGVGNYGSGICFGGADTKGILSCAYNAPSIKIAGGNGTKPVWWIGLSGTSGTSYNLDSMPYAASAGSVAWANISGKPSTFTPASHTHNYSPKPVHVSASATKTCQTNWWLTGVSVTIPANSLYALSGTQVWSNGPCTGIAFTIDTVNSYDFLGMIEGVQTGYVMGTSISGYTPVTQTFQIVEKCGSQTVNNIKIEGAYITF